MNTEKTSFQMIGSGLLSALLASSCCTIPLLLLIAGGSGIASSFSWVEAIRPYLIILSVSVLTFSWYQKLKGRKANKDCCGTREKRSFIQSKKFLTMITVFALAMMSFPLYSNLFIRQYENKSINPDKSNLMSVEFKIAGMTCSTCEYHIEHAVKTLSGIVSSDASYENANAIIQFDSSKLSLHQIQEAIGSTGYKIIRFNNRN